MDEQASGVGDSVGGDAHVSVEVHGVYRPLEAASSGEVERLEGGATEWRSRIHMRMKGPAPIARALERVAGDYLLRLALRSQQNLKRLAETRWGAGVAASSRSVASIAPWAVVHEWEL